MCESKIVFQEIDPSSKKRSDIHVPQWAGFSSLDLDICVTDYRTGHPTLKSVEEEVSNAIRVNENYKHKKYLPFMNGDNYFYPIISETLGRWGPKAKTLFGQLADRVSSATDNRFEAPKWKQEIAMTGLVATFVGLMRRIIFHNSKISKSLLAIPESRPEWVESVFVPYCELDEDEELGFHPGLAFE
jgi:hypothetical protein